MASPLDNLIAVAERMERGEEPLSTPVTEEVHVPTREDSLGNLIRFAALNEALEDAFKAKTLKDLSLFQKVPAVKNELTQFMISAKEIDKSHESFTMNIVNLITLKSNFGFLKSVATSNKVKLLISAGKAQSEALKVFMAKNVREGANNNVVYIDCTGIIKQENGSYVFCNSSTSIDLFISYLNQAMTVAIYTARPFSIVRNTNLMTWAMGAYADMVSYVIQMNRISRVDHTIERTKFLAGMFFQINVMGMDKIYSLAVLRDKAAHYAKITEAEIQTIEYLLTRCEKPYTTDLASFVEAIRVCLNGVQFDITNFLNTWMDRFRPAAMYAPEYFPAFAAMLTSTYHNTQTYNQRTIDAEVDKKIVNLFTSELANIGRREETLFNDRSYPA